MEQQKRAPGITYFQLEGVEGLDFFKCEPHRASLTPSSCARNWTDAQRVTDPDHTLHACRSCPIGAAHAGQKFVPVSWISGSSICARCHRGTTRLIGGDTCVSCYNRELELVKGVNARGNKPVRLSALYPVHVRCLIGERVVQANFERTKGMTEAVVRVLRKADGPVAFGFFALVRPRAQQLPLIERIEEAMQRARRRMQRKPQAQAQGWTQLGLFA